MKTRRTARKGRGTRSDGALSSESEGPRVDLRDQSLHGSNTVNRNSDHPAWGVALDSKSSLDALSGPAAVEVTSGADNTPAQFAPQDMQQLFAQLMQSQKEQADAFRRAQEEQKRLVDAQLADMTAKMDALLHQHRSSKVSSTQNSSPASAESSDNEQKAPVHTGAQSLTGAQAARIDSDTDPLVEEVSDYEPVQLPSASSTGKKQRGSSVSSTRRKHRESRRKERKRKRKGKKGRKRKSKAPSPPSSASSSSFSSSSGSDSSSSSSDGREPRRSRGKLFPNKNSSAVLNSIRNIPALKDKGDPIAWLISFRKEAEDMHWTEAQQRHLLPLVWGDSDPARQSWARTVKKEQLGITDMERSLLRTFDAEGLEELSTQLMSETQPVTMACHTWFASLEQKWSCVLRWSPDSRSDYRRFLLKGVRGHFRNNAMDLLLEKYEGKTLSSAKFLKLCLRADRRTRRETRVNTEIYRVRGHPAGHTQVRQVAGGGDRQRVERKNSVRVGTFAAEAIPPGAIFGRGHVEDPTEICPWHSTMKRCDKGQECRFRHVERDRAMCPAVGASYRDCPRGAYCPHLHPGGEYMIYFRSKSEPGKFNGYTWTDRAQIEGQ